MRVRDLSLAGLCSLESIARTGSLKSAAEDQGVSRPAVSLSVKSLERDLDVTLLRRDSSRYGQKGLTHAGEELARIVTSASPELRGILTRDLSMAGICALESFARTGNYKEAAADQEMSLEGLGTSIKRLQEEVGLPLVRIAPQDRRRKELTPDGWVLAQNAAKLVSELETALQRILTSGQRPRSGE